MTKRLELYESKRNFHRTPEPVGTAAASQGRRLFGIQKHDASHLHYDFRLEHDGAMLSWAVPKGPSLDPHEKRLAVRVEDHPIDYTKFEGTIPAGEYGAGTVLVWDVGTWKPLGDVDEMLRKGSLKFELAGRRLTGSWALVQMHKNEPEWLLIKERDNAAVDGDGPGVIRRFTTSALEKKSHKSKLNPATFEPQLAVLGTRVPPGNEWFHEVKFDGYRILVWHRKGKVHFYTRNGHDWSAKFAHLRDALSVVLPPDTGVDGELVVMNEEGVSDFGALQSWLKHGKGPAPVYYAFDLVELRGDDMTQLTLAERKAELESIVQRAPAKFASQIRYSEHITGHGPEFFENACQQGLEGILSKRASATYSHGRSNLWVKSKCVRQEEFVIGGYTHPQGERTGFGALLVGQYDDQGALKYSGKVGTGFDEAALRDLLKELRGLKAQKNPFSSNPEGVGRLATWLKPRLVAEVRFTERTGASLLRHPVFLGVRTDKEPKEVKPEAMETPKVTVKLSHPERVLFPDSGLTKGGLAEYYALVGEHMLPYVKGRPLAVFRCPEGVGGTCFVQKHGSNGMPASILKQIEGEEESTISVSNVRGLLELVQFGIVEFHIWGSKLTKIDQPDILVFDLDPAPDVEWSVVVEAAFVVGEYLRVQGLKPFVKTTGGKGFHVVAPLRPGSVSWDELKQWTHFVAEDIDHLVPGRFVSTMSKMKRKGRIFIDYLRNGRGATSVAPYSVRAREGAPVSLPIAWDTLSALKSADSFTALNVEEWMPTQDSDPWRDFAKSATRLSARSLEVVRGK